MINKQPFQKIILPNKLTILLYQMKSVLSVHAILFVRVGAIYENPKLRGISHFTEHVSFLGTKKYPTPLALSQRAEALGIAYNAWTNRFSTRYWTSFPYTNIKGGFDFLYEFALEPLVRLDDVEKEKGVVLSEFNDFWHHPDRRFEHEAWRKRFKQKEHPYSYRALGIPETIKNIKRENIHAWRKKYYNPANMILSIAGNVDKKIILKASEKAFSKKATGIKSQEPKFSSNDYSGFSTYVLKEKRPQIRFLLSFPAFGWKEAGRSKRLKLQLLNHIFGRGPASRLFQRLREKERLVYRVGSIINLHTWMGAITIGGSTPLEKLPLALKIIREELDKLSQKGVTDKEIELAKSYVNASSLMRFDNPESIVYFFGQQVFNEEKIWFPEDYIRETNKITKAQLNRLAKEIVDYSKINISLLGDVSETTAKKIEKIFEV
jgi:predicted Zn-dependent peptidase